jgi:hypothetical protein
MSKKHIFEQSTRIPQAFARLLPRAYRWSIAQHENHSRRLSNLNKNAEIAFRMGKVTKSPIESDYHCRSRSRSRQPTGKNVTLAICVSMHPRPDFNNGKGGCVVEWICILEA